MLTRTKLFLAPLACLPFVASMSAVGCGGNGTTTSTTSTGGNTSTSTTTSTMTTTTTSTGMGGTPNVEASDTCPGNLIELKQEQSIKLTGSTAGMKDDYHEFCADSDAATTSAPDVAYQLKVPNYCTFEVNLEEEGSFDGAVEIRAANCSERNVGEDCINNATHGEEFKRELSPGTYFIIVDGANKSSGAYTLTLTCHTPMCGDGVINSAEEQCDPGAPVAGDGCGDPGTANACKFEAAKAADTCADISNTISVDKGANLFVPADKPLFTTAQAIDDYEGSCSYQNAGGPDQVFAVKPTSDGLLTVIVGADYMGKSYCGQDVNSAECWNYVGWIHEADCSGDQSKEMTQATAPIPPIDGGGFGQDGNATCRFGNPAVNDGVMTLSVNATANKTYYVFIEGDTNEGQGHSGPYLLNISLK